MALLGSVPTYAAEGGGEANLALPVKLTAAGTRPKLWAGIS